ncbi:MAG: hypothetical protein ACK5PZ_15670, partial [Pirellula sp.]
RSSDYEYSPPIELSMRRGPIATEMKLNNDVWVRRGYDGRPAAASIPRQVLPIRPLSFEPPVL